MKNKKRGKKEKGIKAQLPAFAWIFSIIIGAVILFFAFFFVTQYGKQVAEPTRAAGIESGIAILLEPFAAVGSLVEAQGSILEFPAGSYIEFGCNIDNDYSEIKARNIKEKTFSLTKKVYDKYLFSQPITTRNKAKLFAFSMPIKEPFYIATPIVIVNGKYCFSSLPLQYKNTLEKISEKINETDSAFNFTSCPSGYIQVNIDWCDSACNYGYIGKKYWFGDLIFPAIFSDELTYNCNLDRMLEREKVLISIYKKKVENLGNKGCPTAGMSSALDNFKTQVDNFQKNKNINNLASLYNSIKQIENLNAGLPSDCKII
ncbi:MAG: hypothetical protein QW244_01485 [Candidatus Pacearchaeota archaeon]